MDQFCPSTPVGVQPQETKKADNAGAFSPATKRLSSRRTSSFSSSSSISTCSSTATFHSSHSSSDDSPRSPATPLQYSGVPFSWEKLPGIPKNQSHHKEKDSNDQSLPLPPPTTSKRVTYRNEPISKSTKSNNTRIARSFRKDPFFAAFVECGKDEDDELSRTIVAGLNNIWKRNDKVPRNLPGRLGFINMYSSCKTGFAVSESIVYLPRSSSRGSYDLLPRRSASS